MRPHLRLRLPAAQPHGRSGAIGSARRKTVDPTVREAPFIDFSSGYVQRAMHKLPKQGSKAPWKLHQNYALDILALRFGALEDGAMVFASPTPAVETEVRAAV